MSVHLVREVERLKNQILALGASVEEALESAVAAIGRRDDQLAEAIVAGDKAIDRAEVEIEEDCLKILALHQPVAHDLRFIIAVMKVNHELERMGDMAVNLSHCAAALAVLAPAPAPFALDEMARLTLVQVHRALDSLVNLDGALARRVWTDDKAINAIHRASYQACETAMMATPPQVPVHIQYLSASRFLERIADNAKNIAKDVLYLTEGEIVRHRGKEFRIAGDESE